MSKKIKTFLPIAAIIAVFLWLAVFAANKGRRQSQTQQRPTVAATIFPLYSLVKQIAGDKISVQQILPTGDSPHTFNPTPRQVEKIQQADLNFVVGADLDNWLLKYQNQKIVNLSSVVTLMPDLYRPDTINPHYWLSIDNAILMAQAISNRLGQQYPQYADYFSHNSQQLVAGLRQIQKKYRQCFAGRTIKIITFHNAYQYFSHDFPIEILAVVAPNPGQEPSWRHLRQIGQTIEQEKIKVIFKEPQLADDLLKSLAQDYQLEIADLDPLGGTPKLNSYQKLLDYNLEQICRRHE